MDWFKKQKLTNWIIGALIIINIVTLVSLWLLQPGRGAAVPPLFPDHEQRVMDLLRSELRLDDEQTAAFRTLRLGHFEHSRKMNARILDTRRQLMDAVLADPPDTLLIGTIADRLGALHREREIENAHHLNRLGTLCTPGQRARFHMLMRDLLPDGEQAGPRDGLRGGTGRGMRNRPVSGRRSGDRGGMRDTLHNR